ncbi:diacylglycerol kinase [Spiroplasma sp. TIUS-1]|uniref:diacylglycerol kinase n=1 Tax=Spiroplasma sp. TIUS-1 TaxID=216963 RepID=UPI00139755B7|nr:diacylglycerol kinase [Spiroplasma sp. TIUS-1]QHX35973.1 diacylglycerol kinase [Spiroplasma sp. TIUS-1]
MAKRSSRNQKAVAIRFKNKFTNAFRGLVIAFKEETTLLLYLVITILAIAVGIFLTTGGYFTSIHWAILSLTIGVVVGFELINTAIENFVDLLSFEYNIKAKKIKDICAAASILNSIAAFLVGCFLFIEPIINQVTAWI